MKLSNIFLFSSGNDSVMAPSTHSHSHPLQNRTFQVPLPNQGLIFLKFIHSFYGDCVYKLDYNFFYFRILTHFQVDTVSIALF